MELIDLAHWTLSALGVSDGTGTGIPGTVPDPDRPGNGPGRDNLLIPGQYHIVPVPRNF